MRVLSPESQTHDLDALTHRRDAPWRVPTRQVRLSSDELHTENTESTERWCRVRADLQSARREYRDLQSRYNWFIALQMLILNAVGLQIRQNGFIRFFFYHELHGNYSANMIKECPIGQKSNKSIQICQIFIIIAMGICLICKDLNDFSPQATREKVTIQRIWLRSALSGRNPTNRFKSVKSL